MKHVRIIELVVFIVIAAAVVILLNWRSGEVARDNFRDTSRAKGLYATDGIPRDEQHDREIAALSGAVAENRKELELLREQIDLLKVQNARLNGRVSEVRTYTKVNPLLKNYDPNK